MDVLHYQNSRYHFFPEEYTKHKEYVDEKIIKLIFSFIDVSLLGGTGLCVCISARTNVARESKILNHGAMPRRNELNDHLVFQLGKIDPLHVVKSRLNLLEYVLKDYSKKALSSDISDDYFDQLELLKISISDSIAPENLTDGLRRISNLSHHGVRSLVEFLGRFKLNMIRNSDAVDRLFSHSPWLLERLYISNAHQRFSQSQGHFPNLFLVDGSVSERQFEVQGHKHSYWLKYLILKRIATSPKSGVSVKDILNEFCNEFGFEDSLVRLALGSLAMVNESRCIEICGAAQDECQDNAVRLTSRGQVLVGNHGSYDQPYCFELSYLQMAIDDHLLSLPREFTKLIAVNTSLAYALEDDSKYLRRMTADLRKNLSATVYFVRVLEAAWNNECRSSSKLAASSRSLGPDFEKIYESLQKTIENVSQRAAVNGAEILSLLEHARSDPRFDSFYESYSYDFAAVTTL